MSDRLGLHFETPKQTPIQETPKILIREEMKRLFLTIALLEFGTVEDWERKHLHNSETGGEGEMGEEGR